MIFFLVLIPLISYCKNVFTDLEIKKSTQKMDFGISQLENTVNGMVSAAQSLSNDIRFLPFFYQEPVYSEITVSKQHQMKDYLNSLVFPLSLITDCAIEFSDDVAITPTFTLFERYPGYYPFHFCVNDMTYEEWHQILEENGSGFLPACQVTTPNKSYNALIYALPWTKTSYLYACLDVSDIRQALIAKSDLDNYRLTIQNTAGELLYTDLTDSWSDYHSVTQTTAIGSLAITVHIPKTALSSLIRPLYHFLGIYFAICLLVLIITIINGSYLSSQPLVRIINLMENSSHINFGKGSKKNNPMPSALQYGFNYIQNNILAYEQNLSEYRTTIDTQTKILQARFLEKALHGSLVNETDIEQFFTYFPDFPENFCLIQLGLLEYPENGGSLYPNYISLIQIYLQNNLSGIFLQQLNNRELLMIIDESDFPKAAQTINYLIENVNREEPSYHAWAIASQFYAHPRSLPSAYWQLQDLYSRVSLDSLSGICSFSEYQTLPQSSFQMADALNLYNAITYGNKEVALLRLQSYADCLNTNNRAVFELLRSILLCIRQDYAGQLIDITVPAYHSQLDMYTEVTNAVNIFCDKICAVRKQTETSPFTRSVREYIDVHFTEDALCLTSLCEHFHCSSSKIQRAFSKDMNISVSAYVEQKRMELASELLLQGEYTVAEVAQKCGFTSDNTFHKAYRRVFGHTPKSIM